MANNLRPSSAINDLRTRTHLALSARLQNLDLTPLLIMLLGSNIPTSILPYLVWQFDMMIPSAPMQALGVAPLTILQNALPLHRKLGTPWALKQALALCGFPGVTLQEGQASWGGSSYPSSEGWAVFRVNMGAAASGALYSQQAGGNTDGLNRSFTLPTAAQPVTGVRVFYNGLLLAQNSYSLAGLNLTTDFTPDRGSAMAVALRASGLTSTVLAYLTQIISFFKPARCYLDSIVSGSPQFFDAAVPTPSGATLVLPQIPTSLELYRDGIYQTAGIDFVLAGDVITPALAPGSDRFVAYGTYGSSSTAPNFADWITPAGAVDGSNYSFTLPQPPNPAASLKLYLNSLLQEEGTPGDYTLSGTTITFASAPPLGSTIAAFYRY